MISQSRACLNCPNGVLGDHCSGEVSTAKSLSATPDCRLYAEWIARPGGCRPSVSDSVLYRSLLESASPQQVSGSLVRDADYTTKWNSRRNPSGRSRWRLLRKGMAAMWKRPSRLPENPRFRELGNSRGIDSGVWEFECRPDGCANPDRGAKRITLAGGRPIIGHPTLTVPKCRYPVRVTGIRDEWALHYFTSVLYYVSAAGRKRHPPRCVAPCGR